MPVTRDRPQALIDKLLGATARRSLDCPIDELPPAPAANLASRQRPPSAMVLPQKPSRQGADNDSTRSAPSAAWSSADRIADVWSSVIGSPCNPPPPSSATPLVAMLLQRRNLASHQLAHASKMHRPASISTLPIRPPPKAHAPSCSSSSTQLHEPIHKPSVALATPNVDSLVGRNKRRSPSSGTATRFSRARSRGSPEDEALPAPSWHNDARLPHMAPMTSLSTTAQEKFSWWKIPPSHMLRAAAFDRRQIEGRRRAGNVLDALEHDGTSISKALAFRHAVFDLERNRYVAPYSIQAHVSVRKAVIKPELVQEAPPPKAPQAWSLDVSIWAPRKKWCDSKDYYDSEEVERSKFDLIWQASRVEQGIDKLILRNDDDGAADDDGDGTPDEVFEVGEVLWEFHDLLFCLFDYYCAVGMNLATLAFNQWSEFVMECKLVSKKSKFCKKADMDRLFISVDSRTGKPSKALNRVEFLAALVHLSIARYMLTGEVGDASEAMFKLVATDIEQNMDSRLFEEGNFFRREFCYREDVSVVLAKYEPSLRRLFLGIAASDGSTVGKKHLASLLNFDEWRLFIRLAKLVGPDLTERDAKLCFAWARMAVIDGSTERGAVKEANLPFEGFLEYALSPSGLAICRLAVLKSLPTDNEIVASESADAGMHMRHLFTTDEAGYNDLIRSRTSPWPGSFQNPRQPHARCVEHMIMMLIRTVQGGPAAGPCGSGSSVCTDELEQHETDAFSKLFLDKLGTG